MNKYSDLHQRPFTSFSSTNPFSSTKSLLTSRPPQSEFQNFNEALSSDRMLSSQLFSKTWEALYSPRSSTYQDTQRSGKSIDDSQYQISVNFPDRPKTSSISGLTLQENERVMTSSRTLLTSRENVEFPTIFSSHQKLPGERDFNRILNKIEMIVSNKYIGHRGATLREGEAIEIMAEQSSISFLKIYTKGKRCPMRVHIKKYKGKLIIYTSRHNPEPTESLHDESFKAESFEISDPGLKFKNEYMHFGIQALEDSTFAISVNFGRLKISLNKKRKTERQDTLVELESLRKNEMLQYELNKKVDNAIARRKFEQLQKLSEKDFLKMNMNILPPNSPRFVKEKEKFQRKIEERRKSAKVKHRLSIQEKQQRAVNVVNKKLLRAEEEKQERLRREELILLQKEQQEWFIVINLALAMVSIRERWLAKRKEKLESFKKSMAARKIQNFFRKRHENTTISELCINRSKSALIFYINNIKPIQMIKYRYQISKCIYESARNHTLPHHFSAFTQSIFNVQKVWREYNTKNKERWDELITLWNQTLEKKILELSKTKPAKGKKRRDESSKYLKISAIARNHVLTEYFRDCKRSFREKIRKFIELRKMHKVIKQWSAKYLRNDDIGLDQDSLVFTFMPDEANMLQLIEKAIEVAIN